MDLLEDEPRDLSAHSSSKGDASAPRDIDGDVSAQKRQKRDASAHSDVGNRLNALFDSNRLQNSRLCRNRKSELHKFKLVNN